MKSTLALHLFPTRSIARDAGLILAGTALTALCAQITIPFFPVPFTLQTFAVLLTAFALGSRRGFLAQLAYIVAGIAGAPIFSGWTGGIGHLVGPTGGYLVGFAVAAWLVGGFAERGWDRKFLLSVAAMALGSAVILAFGTAWLALFLGWDRAFWAGMAPFAISDVVKCIAASIALPIAWQFTGRKA
jgi:biotin transport system substrate-specific component